MDSAPIRPARSNRSARPARPRVEATRLSTAAARLPAAPLVAPLVVAPLAIALALLASACSGESERPRAPRPPDVVMVLIDTLRSDRLSSYGYPLPTTPRIDRFAEEGALFTDVTSQATWTLPSMVSILHGRYLTAYRDSLSPALPTLPELFQQAGYKTVGLVCNKGLTPLGGFDRGFDVFDSQARPMSTLEQDVWEQLDAVADGFDWNDAHRPPLFLYLHPMDPHMPYVPHPELDAEVPPTGAPPAMPREWQREVFAARGTAGPERDPEWSKRWEHINAARGRYDQGVRYTDDGLARIFEGLEQRGLMDGTVVAILSDHGEVLWERITPSDPAKVDLLPPDEFFYREHGGHLTQETIGTPLILFGPGVPAGVRFEGPVENVDLAPTLLDLVGLDHPPGLHGRSLVARLAAPEDGPDFVFTFNHAALSVREPASGLKLILPTDDHNRYRVEAQLYHLPSDPAEHVNLHTERPDDVARLTAALDTWRAEHETDGTWDQPMDPELREALRELGYTDTDIGR